MTGRGFTASLIGALRAVRLGRVGLVVGSAVLAGLVCDWLRAEQRLVFPRPLPVFTTSAPRP